MGADQRCRKKKYFIKAKKKFEKKAHKFFAITNNFSGSLIFCGQVQQDHSPLFSAPVKVRLYNVTLTSTLQKRTLNFTRSREAAVFRTLETGVRDFIFLTKRRKSYCKSREKSDYIIHLWLSNRSIGCQRRRWKKP